MKWSQKSGQGDLVDGDGLVDEGFLVVGWGLIAERAVKTAGIIESFDVIEDHAVGLGAGVWRTCVEALGFQSGPEAFHGGVVVTVRSAAHAWDDVVGVEQGTERLGGILAAAV